MLLFDGFGSVAAALGVEIRRIYRRLPVVISSPHIVIGIVDTVGGLVRGTEVVEERGVSGAGSVDKTGPSRGRWSAW
jgi:hypothetical protein